MKRKNEFFGVIKAIYNSIRNEDELEIVKRSIRPIKARLLAYRKRSSFRRSVPELKGKKRKIVKCNLKWKKRNSRPEKTNSAFDRPPTVENDNPT